MAHVIRDSRLWLWLATLLLGACPNRGGPVDLDAPGSDAPPSDAPVPDTPRREGGCLTPEARVDLPVDAPTRDQRSDAPVDAPADAPLADLAADTAGSDAIPDTLPWPCPDSCMVLINNTFCIDRYEASRPDATATSQGVKSGAARCVKGVIPWNEWPLSRATAAKACALAGKRLCTPKEWQGVCSGPKKLVYAYGNTYEPATCNGIDTFCYCGPTSACAGVTPCPYAFCYAYPPPSGKPAGGCGANFHLTPTGSLSGCKDANGIYDLNGNVWELVDTTDAYSHFRGGAFNCGDSKTYHRCDYDATWGPSAQGFRCCADATILPE